MAGLKPYAKVTRFFITGTCFTDTEIVAWLKDCNNIKVTSEGPGGYPTHGVFHLEDQFSTWIGSRLDGYDGKVLVFFANDEGDPIFGAIHRFAEEISRVEKKEILAHIATLEENIAKTEREAREARVARMRATNAVATAE